VFPESPFAVCGASATTAFGYPQLRRGTIRIMLHAVVGERHHFLPLARFDDVVLLLILRLTRSFKGNHYE
jgi:hypothetical protein